MARIHQLYGKAGGLACSAKHGGKAMTAAANRSNATRWERQVDPEGTLPAVERHQRAEAAKRAHMAKLAAKSAQARSKKAGKR